LHDYEIKLGADKALCLKLGYAFMTNSSPVEELRLIGQCLRQVYQCSTEQRTRSFLSMGESELTPLLVQVLMNGLSQGENFPSDTLIIVVEILRIYAKLEVAKHALIHMKKGQWIGQILQYCLGGTLGTNASSVSPLLVEILGMIKDLTFRSSVSDKEKILSVREGVFGGLIASICQAAGMADYRLVDWFTAVVWNLVLDKPICDKFLHIDVSHDFPVIGYLVRILNGGRKPCMVSDNASATKIRRNAISCIGNMLSHVDNQIILVGGPRAKTLAILPTLVDLVERDEDSIVRRRAMRTIRCMACSEDDSVRVSLNYHDLRSLFLGVLSRRIAEDDEHDRDTQVQACMAMCVSMDLFPSSDWPRLETVLLRRIETCFDERLIEAACSCYIECLKRSPLQRGPSCFTELFWARLELAASPKTAAQCATISLLLLELARLEKDIPESANSQHPSNLTNPTAIKILILLLSFSSKEHCGVRQNALEAVECLISKSANRRALAGNEGLLSALVNLCLLQPDTTSKDAAKKIIIDLVPEL